MEEGDADDDDATPLGVSAEADAEPVVEKREDDKDVAVAVEVGTRDVLLLLDAVRLADGSSRVVRMT